MRNVRNHLSFFGEVKKFLLYWQRFRTEACVPSSSLSFFGHLFGFSCLNLLFNGKASLFIAAVLSD